ncbi:MAG: flavodoxin family protein [Mucilaginibacter polytrichastri]|nr:flavodoxin family protein [Mucilaginibacter polytrichastri]
MLKAIYLNCSLKKASEQSNTEALINKSLDILQTLGVSAEVIRISDYDIPAAMETDAGGDDQWPQIFEKIKAANILVIGSPIWLGEKSSLCTKVIERIYAGSDEKNDAGQAVYYNKVGGVIVTGNEDGAKHVSAEVLYALAHVGFTIPPNVDAYWIGEAGPGPSYIEAGQENSFTKSAIKTLSYNVWHFASMLDKTPIPGKGNLLS